MRLHFVTVFSGVQKEDKNEENKQLLEGLYFKNGWRDLLQTWYVLSPDMPAPVQQIWFC